MFELLQLLRTCHWMHCSYAAPDFSALGPDVNECGTDAMFQCNSEGESGAESTEDDADLADLLADWRPGPYVAYSHSEDDEAADDRSGLSVCVFVCVCVYLCVRVCVCVCSSSSKELY